MGYVLKKLLTKLLLVVVTVFTGTHSLTNTDFTNIINIINNSKPELITELNYATKLMKTSSKTTSVLLPQIRHIEGADPLWSNNKENYIQIDFPDNYKSLCIYNAVLLHELAHSVETIYRIGYPAVKNFSDKSQIVDAEIVALTLVLMHMPDHECLDWIKSFIAAYYKSQDMSDNKKATLLKRSKNIHKYMVKHYQPILKSLDFTLS